MTKQTMASPLISSGRATTAASATAGMADQRAFDFHRAEAVAGDFDHVIHAAEHPDVAVFVALRGVAREINAGNAAPVFAREAFIIAINRAQHRRPRFLDGQIARLAGRHGFALQVHHARDDARQRQAWRNRASSASRRAAAKS